jgi:cell division protein FtsB
MANPYNPIDIATRQLLEAAAPTEAELQAHALHRELQQERARERQLEAHVRHLESALKTAGRVLQPYLSGTRR